ncbi:HDOD domain-containing protein [bacterium]|nr:HDOD domain-containing protein [bacterium]
MDYVKLLSELLPTPDTLVLPPKIKLPALPTVVMEFSKLAEDPNASTQKLGQLVETDSTLTCELLRYSNSAAFAGRQKISVARQAIARVGVRNARNFLLAAAVQQTMKASKSKLINIQNLWLTNLERALFAKEIAQKLGADGDLAYSGSLLQDCLLPALSNELFPVYCEFLKQPETSSVTLVQFEQRHLGWDHTRATAHVLHAWGFPADLICCVRLHHQGLAALQSPAYGESPIAAVAVAALMADPVQQTPDGMKQLIQLDGVWPDFKLHDTAERVAEQLTEITPLAAQHATLSRRLSKHLAAAQ